MVIKGLLVGAVLAGSATNAMAGTQQWVTSDRLDRKTCPSTKCGTVGQLMSREVVEVLEVQNGWTRISRPYSASCVGGKSERVKMGNDACNSANGIKNGQFAEWVESKYLTANSPIDPCNYAVGGDALVCGSDDYHRYKALFTDAARKLIDAGVCTENDFREMGGWVKSNSMGSAAYFIYCGGMKLENKVYLDAVSGQTFR